MCCIASFHQVLCAVNYLCIMCYLLKLYLYHFKCTEYRKGRKSYIGRQTEAFSIGQGEQLVIIQHGVQVLNPFRIHVSVEDDPLALLQLSPHVINNPGGLQITRYYTGTFSPTHLQPNPFDLFMFFTPRYYLSMKYKQHSVHDTHLELINSECKQ